MVFATKFLRKFLCLKPYNQIITGFHSKKLQNFRKYHRTLSLNVKMFMENENKYAYDIMLRNGYVIDFSTNKAVAEDFKNEDFLEIVDKKWLKENPHKLFEKFSALGLYCSEHNICISDKQFDEYIDTITDNIKLATDKELKLLFFGLSNWPETNSIRTRNYIEVWAALDDECIKRINKWLYDEMFIFISLFYMLNVVRVSDFCFKCLQKFASKARQLTSHQIVKSLFFIGIARKSPHDIHNLEVQIEDRFKEFSIDELAIIAMGLFKSKTPIRSVKLSMKIIDSIIANSKTVHEVTLAALLKIIRYSTKVTDDNKVYDLLTSLQHEIPRLSIMCIVQVALVGTSTLTLHESCLNKIADTLATSLPNARLKDLERLVLTYGTFNYTPKTKHFFKEVIDELRKPEREQEIKEHGRSLACCVSFLGLLGIHPADLINQVLSPQFLEQAYGKHFYQYGREILCVHNMAKIFLNDAPINLLNDKQVINLSKKYTDYVPDENYVKNYNALDKMFIDIMKLLQNCRGGKEYATGYHILPHHQRGDIIICDDHKGFPCPVDKVFETQKFGLISRPIDNNFWIALIIANRNSFLNSGLPTGYCLSKVRELNALGFYAAIVNWNIYTKLQSQKDKIMYLNTLIQQSIQSKEEIINIKI